MKHLYNYADWINPIDTPARAPYNNGLRLFLQNCKFRHVTRRFRGILLGSCMIFAKEIRDHIEQLLMLPLRICFSAKMGAGMRRFVHTFEMCDTDACIDLRGREGTVPQ